MKKMVLIVYCVLIYSMSFAKETPILSIDVKPADNDAGVLIIYLKNNSNDYRIQLCRNALQKDGRRSIVPNARYHVIALFPLADDQRTEECVALGINGRDAFDCGGVISISPNETYSFKYVVASGNLPLRERIMHEPHMLFWSIELLYKKIAVANDLNDDNGQREETQATGVSKIGILKLMDPDQSENVRS